MLQHALLKIRDGMLGLAYPEHCRVCGEAVESWDDGVACARCWEDITVTRPIGGVFCHKCGLPISRGSTPKDAPSARALHCGTCSSFPFEAARACGIYSGALEASILFLKVNPHICTRLRELILSTLAEHRDELASDLIIPVPLHRSREKQRGFNQAAIIARAIAREFNATIDTQSLSRVKPTDRHRAGLDAVDRAKSVEGAFEVKRPRVIQGTTVLIVDDVYTTGSTLSSAAETLLDGGAARVNVLTIARVLAD